MNMNRKEIRKQVIEAIITHPKERFEIRDITKQLPKEIEKTTVLYYVRRFVMDRFLEVIRPGHGGKTGIYRIVSREISFQRKPWGSSRVQPKDELNMAQVGESIMMFIDKLKTKIRDLGESYGNIQSEMNKSNSAYRLDINGKQTLIDELKKECTQLRNRIRQIEQEKTGRTFKLSEVVNFK